MRQTDETDRQIARFFYFIAKHFNALFAQVEMNEQSININAECRVKEERENVAI